MSKPKTADEIDLELNRGGKKYVHPHLRDTLVDSGQPLDEEETPTYEGVMKTLLNRRKKETT